MAKELSPEHIEIRRKGRQRLIGAITLALLLVVFVPMLLDPEPRQQRPEPVLAIPSKQSPPPLPAPLRPPPAAPATSAPPGAAPSSPAGLPASGKPPPAVAAPATVVKDSAPAAKAPAVPRLEGFAVQVGAFKEEAKLVQAREKLAAARVPHYIERLSTGSGELTRLRAGPFPTRESAEKAAADVKRAGLEGQVVPLP